MALKLIVESRFNEDQQLDYLIESQQDGIRKYLIEGPFVQTNVPNRNGRVYPKDLMISAVDDYIKDRLDPTKGIRSYGELGHPDGVEINPDRISHYTQSLNWVGNDCMGKAEILDTPMGKIVMTILEKKLKLATSTRGLGSLSEAAGRDGAKEVESYEMIASDIVIDPSAPQGFVNGILENKEFIIKNDNETGVRRIVECYNKLEKDVSVLPKHNRDEHFADALTKFLKGI